MKLYLYKMKLYLYKHLTLFQSTFCPIIYRLSLICAVSSHFFMLQKLIVSYFSRVFDNLSLLKETKLYFCLTQTWFRIIVLNFINIMVREMISPKLKDFTSRHWAEKLDVQKV